ncbi:divalent metal cation transporter [Natrialba sp. INN-245]|uniref:NRAMP family divalent metal transporter n=1 Tax=Natrialba sp. INN-245 TaxID=2690967 RepID=UPI001313A326|nr:divalent metal cation transporter [Natrialba sp. INN-245]MWV41510.1 divalent metal cation transporter [Natrialba sp. INN-245]
MGTEGVSHESTATRRETLGRYLSKMGPAWLAGAIAAGPATMASVITAGAAFEYALLWVVIASAVLGTTAQYLSMRLGLLTEAGIVGVVEEHIGEFWAWVLVIDAVLASGLAQIVIMKTLADVSAAITGVDARLWGIAWAAILAIGLAVGGYSIAELGAKVIVSAVVLAFVASVFVVPIDPGAAATGLIPVIPDGLSGALIAAGVLGGAVHITLVTMHTYTLRARGWTREEYDLGLFDVGASMLVAFGIFSLATFLVAASVLHTPDLVAAELDAAAAAEALGPLAGEYAQWLFLLGLWGAAISTLGANTVVPPYLLADKFGWEADVSDARFKVAIVAVAAAGAIGAFLEGAFFPLLVLVLAFGLIGTPFALVVVLYLLNHPDAVPEPNPRLANVGGLILVGVAAVTAGSFVRDELTVVASDPLSTSGFVVTFAVVMTVATAGLIGKYVLAVRTRFD